jgi:tRNA A37 threonylcarbamoyladenosine synthetase subunit TsaC/SUA5/YrdC
MNDRQYFIDDPRDVEEIAEALANGAVVAQAFANFYVLTTRADEPTVRRINLVKGRPADQVGSVVTTMIHIDDLFDWRTLPDGLTKATVRRLIDALYEYGPLGFRGPAAGHIPDHMTCPDDGVRTVQLIAPGYNCPSNGFLARALARSCQSFLYVTSANRSRHQTGVDEEPAHYRGDALAAEFGQEPGFRIIRHRNEAAARAAYPLYEPMSTTIMAFHKLARAERGDAPTLLVERHGSLSFESLATIVARFGFRLALAPKAVRRLALRVYPSNAKMEAVT